MSLADAATRQMAHFAAIGLTASATYTPADGSAESTFTIMPGPETASDELVGDDDYGGTTCEAAILRSDVDAPAVGDQVTIGGVVWVVAAVESKVATMSMLRLRRTQRTAAGTPGARMPGQGGG